MPLCHVLYVKDMALLHFVLLIPALGICHDALSVFCYHGGELKHIVVDEGGVPGALSLSGL